MLDETDMNEEEDEDDDSSSEVSDSEDSDDGIEGVPLDKTITPATPMPNEKEKSAKKK